MFGFSLDDYDAFFVEKVALFAELNESKRVTFRPGQFRPALRNAEIGPRPVQPKLPVWIGAGSPDSVVRAARLGYPLAIPMLGGTRGPMPRSAYVQMLSPPGALVGGSSQEVIDKLLAQHHAIGNQPLPRTDRYRRSAFRGHDERHRAVRSEGRARRAQGSESRYREGELLMKIGISGVSSQLGAATMALDVLEAALR